MHVKYLATSLLPGTRRQPLHMTHELDWHDSAILVTEDTCLQPSATHWGCSCG